MSRAQIQGLWKSNNSPSDNKVTIIGLIILILTLFFTKVTEKNARGSIGHMEEADKSKTDSTYKV